MKSSISFLVLATLLFACSPSKNNTFTFVAPDQISTINIKSNADSLVVWAANELANDLQQISGKQIAVKVSDEFTFGNGEIYIGQYKTWNQKNIPGMKDLQQNWETYSIQKIQSNLCIVGSDVRGTVYGIFDVAERLGISPWIWWADSNPEKRETISLKLPEEGIVSGPSVKYRGIFLNDEDWGLQPWAAKNFEPETGDIGPKTYEKIFQLLLRLKANTIWPAMHPCTSAFYHIPDNNEIAKKYHIVVGTSHCEPMLRNNVDEWKLPHNQYNYFNNKEGVSEYWAERISQVDDAENIITLGMRGVHDGHMQGGKNDEERLQMVEQIIDDQRQMLTQIKNKPLDSIATTMVLYKEVLDMYNDGLKIPEEVTITWCDDNYGYIRRLSNDEEQKRSGGSGVYYHLSYWGRPHDYLWLSSTQPGLIWFEMMRAYENGARQIWIANVGDIKPAEYNTEFFLDLAWDVNSISENTIQKHMRQWMEREFGKKNATKLTQVMQEYYRLAMLRKPEFMGWSQTEPSTATRMTEFSISNDNELQRRLDAYATLNKKLDAMKPNIPAQKQDAFFQLVEYPVKGAALMNEKFLYVQQSFHAEDQTKKEALAEKSLEAYEEIKTLTAKYNDEISNGKWKYMMSMNPRRLAAFNMPEYHLQDNPDKDEIKAEYTGPEPIFIQAKDFYSATAPKNFKWKSVQELGYSNAAITLFPLKNVYFKGEKPQLEYTFDISEPGEYEIEVRCLPTHANNFDHLLSLQVNDEAPKEFKLNTRGRSSAWKQNVLRNYVSVKLKVTFDQPGKQTLTASVNQTGIVLDQLAIIPVDYPGFYEIPLE